jgi:hypothetical protein
MLLNLKSDRDSTICPTVRQSRRRMLRTAFFGGLVPLVLPTGVIAFVVGNNSRNLNFGPNYSVLEVSNTVVGTQVLLGFQVNGRSFTTKLESIDRRVWRPV